VTYFKEATITSAYEALDANRDWAAVRAALRFRCPWCHAHANQPCHSQGRPLALGNRLHPSREALTAPEAV
jgi:uncharacterized membrane protein